MISRIWTTLYFVTAASVLWFLVDLYYHFTKTLWKKILVLVSGVLMVPMCLLSDRMALVIPIFTFLISILVASDKWVDRIINVLMLDAAISMVDDFIRTIINTALNIEKNDYYMFWSIILTGLIVILVSKTKSFQKVLESAGSISRWKKFLILLVMILTLNVFSFGFSLLEPGKSNIYERAFLLLAMLMMLSVVGVVTLLYIELYRKLSLQKDNEAKEIVIGEQKAIYNLLLEKTEDTRRFRHDISNNLGVLHILLEKGRVDDAIDFLESMSAENDSLKMKNVYYGNDVLDTVISMMCWRAKQKNIDILVSGEMEVDKLNLYELCCIFSNALGNAVEACERLQTNGPINVIVKSSESMVVIKISNPATEDMFQNINNGRTSKEDKEQHGLGIKNIKTAVARLNGDCEYSFQDGNVSIIISIET